MNNNKRGQALVGVGILAVLLVMAAIGGFAAWKSGVFSADTQTVIKDKTLSATDCETAPTISVGLVNMEKQGTVVSSPTVHYRIDGEYFGTTAPSSLQKGQEVELLLSKANFVDKTVASFEAACGNNLVSETIYATSTNTFRVFNTNSQLVTDDAAGGATNQSSSASPISMQVWIDSTTDESTGDLIVVIEATNTTQVDSLKLSGTGVTDASVPEFYSPVAAGSISDAFKVPALIDGDSKSYTLKVTPESGQTIDGTSVYITAYSEQAFVDVDGTYKVGVEDSDGTAKYEDTWDYDFIIT